SVDFEDEFFLNGLKRWLDGKKLNHDASHVHSLQNLRVPAESETTGREIARELLRNKAIMGVFDEGCMGMYNAIIPDELLHRTGVFKERLSQSALFAKMLTVSNTESGGVFDWLRKKGLKFRFGKDEETELSEGQVLQQ